MIFIKKRNGMNMNTNHPTFITFLEQITLNVLSNINVDNYFTLSNEKKLNTQYGVFKIFKESIRFRATFTDEELKSLIILLWKKNMENENYELASVLDDIKENFIHINEFTKPKRKPHKKIKIENND